MQKYLLPESNFLNLVRNINNYKKIMGKVKFGIRPEERSLKSIKG